MLLSDTSCSIQHTRRVRCSLAPTGTTCALLRVNALTKVRWNNAQRHVLTGQRTAEG